MSEVDDLFVDLGVWITISELAKRKGVSRQAAREKVDRLERSGLLTTQRRGANRMVELASFDRAVGDAGDAVRESGAATKRQSTLPAQGAPLRDAQTERTKYDAALRALDYAERTKQLVAVKGSHGIEAALIRVSEEILRDMGQPLSWVQELMEKTREGEPAVRRFLRGKIHDQRRAIAIRLQAMSDEASGAEAGGIETDINFGEEI
jgi:DNA-binding transcriptional ArsR family regulator